MNQAMSDELVKGLRTLFEKYLVSIILYGSVARGTETSESDIDIAIILKDAKNIDVTERLLDFTVALDLKYDKVFSVVDIDYNEFQKWQMVSPFYNNLKKDGVVLWTAA